MEISHIFSELQLTAACGAFIVLSEGGTMFWLGCVCVLNIKPFILPMEGCVVRPHPSPRGTACQPECVQSQLPSPCHSSEMEEKNNHKDSNDSSVRFGITLSHWTKNLLTPTNIWLLSGHAHLTDFLVCLDCHLCRKFRPSTSKQHAPSLKERLECVRICRLVQVAEHYVHKDIDCIWT